MSTSPLAKYATNPLTLVVLSGLVIIFWASAYVGIRYALTCYHPGSMALLRYLVASICMAIVYPLIRNKKPVALKDLSIIAFAGMLGIGLYSIMLHKAEVVLPAAITSFTIGQAPIIAVILAVIFLGERLKPITFLGIILGTFGLSLIAYSHHANLHAILFYHHMVFAIVAVFCSGFYVVLQKPLLNRVNPMQFVCYVVWAGTALLFINSPQLIHDISRATWSTTATVVYLGIVPASVTYLLWSYLLSKISVVKASGILYAIPIVTILLGFLFLKETMNIVALAGGLVSLLGAYLVGRC